MDIFIVLFGIAIIIFGIKLPKLFNGLFESVKDERQIIKMGFTFKIAGYIVLIGGNFQTKNKIFLQDNMPIIKEARILVISASGCDVK